MTSPPSTPARLTLVTGATGCIGGRLVRALDDAGGAMLNGIARAGLP